MSLNTEYEYLDQDDKPLQIGDTVVYTWSKSNWMAVGIISEFRKSFVILENGTRRQSENLLKI